MMKRNSQFQSSLATACSVLLMLSAGQPGLAQQSATDKPAAAGTAAKLPAPQRLAAQTAAEEKVATAPAKPGVEGIKVHGHWIIDVRNPDGSLAQHRDFENSLADGGYFLTGAVSGYALIGGYFINLVGNACTPLTYGYSNCYIPQTGASNWECGVYYTCIGSLTAVPNFGIAGVTASSLVVSGSAVIPMAGTISAVQTLNNYCYSQGPPGVIGPANLTSGNPAACTATNAGGGNTNGWGYNTLTGTTLTTPLSVTAGQAILVTVTISFS